MLLDVLFTFSDLNEYIAIALAIFFSLLISIVLFSLVTLVTFKQYDVEKTASFECGFHPFEDTREKFNIRFYLVSILFIIFDLEITYLFPWAISLRYIDFVGFWSMFTFLFILTLGFVYEWIKGALDWE